MIEPIRVKEKQAAVMLGVSGSYLRAARLRDKELIADGKAPDGPPWVLDGRSVFYYTADVVAWAEDRRKAGIACGRQNPPGASAIAEYNFRRKGKKATDMATDAVVEA